MRKPKLGRLSHIPGYGFDLIEVDVLWAHAMPYLMRPVIGHFDLNGVLFMTKDMSMRIF